MPGTGRPRMRGAFLILTGALLLAGPVRAGPNHAALAREGALTWYVASMAADTAEHTAAAFRAASGITVDVIRMSGQTLFQRLTQDLRAGAPICDVFSSTDIAHYDWLKRRNLLAHYVPADAARVRAPFRDADPDGFFHVTTADLLVLLYNRDQVPVDQAPQAWTDLLDARWKGRLGLSHPGFSGAMGVWALAMTERHGDAFLEGLARNQPQVGRSLNDTVTMITAGERAVAPGILPTALRARARGNPIEIAYPKDGALLLLFVSGIMADSRHPASARLFMDWLLGPEQSAIEAADFYQPLRPEIAQPAGVPALADIAVMTPRLRAGETAIPELVERWRDLFGN